MPIVSVGDMAQHFISQRNGGTIKTEFSRLAESLSTGRVTDIAAELSGETTRLSGISHTLSQLEAYAQSATETDLMLSSMQTVLQQVDLTRSQTGSQLLLLNDSSSVPQINEAGHAAKDAFGEMVNSLNTRFADRTLMGGTAVDQPALASAEDMLVDLQAAIGAATDQATITAAVDAWFDDPAGGFAAVGYLGDTGPVLTKRISDTKSYQIDARADDPAIREVLKGAALAALAGDLSTLDSDTKSDLLQDAGSRLIGSSAGLIAVQSRIGFIESEIVQTQVELNAQETALQMSKNDLISADPFDIASQLQSVQLQLETHYSVTARLSQISLLDYI